MVRAPGAEPAGRHAATFSVTCFQGAGGHALVEQIEDANPLAIGREERCARIDDAGELPQLQLIEGTQHQLRVIPR